MTANGDTKDGSVATTEKERPETETTTDAQDQSISDYYYKTTLNHQNSDTSTVAGNLLRASAAELVRKGRKAKEVSMPRVIRKRYYWYWVTACSRAMVESQDRYYCTEDGRIVCRAGWKWRMCEGAMCPYLETPASFCSEPVCSAGCHPDHGYCSQPHSCTCKLGYQGENCTDLTPLPGCMHGVAETAEQLCVCKAGWSGHLCTIPVCREGCHGVQGYCQEPGQCLCRTGWSGPDCAECVPYPGCDEEHGHCHQPWQCNCASGWQGTYCNNTAV